MWYWIKINLVSLIFILIFSHTVHAQIKIGSFTPTPTNSNTQPTSSSTPIPTQNNTPIPTEEPPQDTSPKLISKQSFVDYIIYWFRDVFGRIWYVIVRIGNPAPKPTPAPQKSPKVTPKPSKVPTQAPREEEPTPEESPAENEPTPEESGDDIQSLIDAVSEDRLREYLSNIVDDDTTPEPDEAQTRWSGSSGFQTESEYVKNHFDSLGIDSRFQNFSFPYGSQYITTRNIIATIPGQNKNEAYVIGAHLDSTSARNNTREDPAPGADDDGTGSVMVMEIARVLKESNFKPQYTIILAEFSGEEQGLIGSGYYVNNLPSNLDIRGMINLDMMGHTRSGDCTNFIYKPYNGGDVLANKLIEMNNAYSIGLETNMKGTGQANSDHKRFWDIGVPATFSFECDFSPVYHTTEDKTDLVNFGLITKLTKTIVATIADLTK